MTEASQEIMDRKRIKKFAVLLILFSVVLGSNGNGQAQTDTVGENVPKAPRLIAHAGGEIFGLRLTNSVQALDNSYNKNFRFFEVDINWTADEVPVLVHDWGTANWFMNVKYSVEPPAYKEFKARKTILDLQLMDLDMLEEWLAGHKASYIITDVKKDNIKVLNMIKRAYPNIYSRIIPQIYSIEEYDPVKRLGYKNIILTLYNLKATEDEIMDFCRRNALFGLTVYHETASSTALDAFSRLGIPVYVHSINDYNEYVKLRDKGVYGVYTDYLQPSGWNE